MAEIYPLCRRSQASDDLPVVAHHFGHLGLVEKFQNGQRIFPGSPQQVPVLRQRKGGVALKEITGQGADLLV